MASTNIEKKPKSRKLLKWFGIVLGSFFILLVAVAILVPLFVDVDQFRPQIESAVNDQIHGKFELGKLKLSLWGEIKVKVDGFSIKDASSVPILASKDVDFHMPFSSVLFGSPRLTLKIKHPEVYVEKNKRGKLNVMSLIKPPSAPQAAGAAPVQSEGTVTARPVGLPKDLPGIVTRARFGFDMENAHLTYVDKTTDLKSEVKSFHFKMKDFSLSHTMYLEVEADLDTKMGKLLDVKGPVSFTASVTPELKSSNFQSAQVEFKASADELDIQLPGLFSKSKKIPAHLTGQLKAGLEGAAIKELTAVFHNAKMTLTGATGAFVYSDADESYTSTVNMDLQSNKVDLAPWNQLSPLLKDYDLSGQANLSAHLGGTTLKPDYKADVLVDNLMAKAPMLKAKPRIDMAIKVLTDRLEDLKITLQGPGTDLAVQGKVVSFTKPVGNFSVTSKGMDLDQWIEFPKPKPGAPAGGAPSSTAQSGTPAKTADYDSMLDGVRENPILKAAKLGMNVNIPFIKLMNVRISEIQSKMGLAELTAKLESFHLKVFDGTVNANSTIQLLPKRPTYTFQSSVAGFDMKKAVTSQIELFKNTVYGVADFKITGNGSSFNTPAALKNLQSQGSFNIKNATFASIDITKVVSTAANNLIQGLGDKFPGIKGKSVNISGNKETAYEFMAAAFTIKDGLFDMPAFVAKAKPNQGIDLNGATQVGLIDMSLNADWKLIDTYNLSSLRNVSLEQQGVRVDPLLAEGNNPVTLPVKVKGTLFAPQFDYSAVVTSLAGTAANNVAKAVRGKLESEAKKKVAEELKKAAPAPLKKVLEGLNLGF